MRYTLERVIRGMDTISATGNILRDYLTDLFPIMELGTSAKMLSIVPLMAGGGMYETGAGGSAPKHAATGGRNHLRWDSLGEFLALAVSPKTLGSRTRTRARNCWRRRWMLPPARCSTTTRAGAEDGSARQSWQPVLSGMYWAQELAAQTKTRNWQRTLRRWQKALADNEKAIVSEFAAVQGKPADIGGYYWADVAKGRGHHASGARR